DDNWNASSDRGWLDHTPPFGTVSPWPRAAQAWPDLEADGAAAQGTTLDLPAPAAAADSRFARPAISAEQAVDAITDAANRDEIGDAIIDYLRSTFGFGLVFIVQREMALGWKGFAPGVDDRAFQSLAIPLTAPSVLQLAYESKQIFRGAPSLEGGPLDSILWRRRRSS